MNINAIVSCLRKWFSLFIFTPFMSHTDALEGKFWATELRDLQNMTLRT
jgi:hypothetical protein